MEREDKDAKGKMLKGEGLPDNVVVIESPNPIPIISTISLSRFLSVLLLLVCVLLPLLSQTVDLTFILNSFV